ncbi:MAG: hypothetical protein WC415_03195 [Patescibacteria group bacterium]
MKKSLTLLWLVVFCFSAISKPNWPVTGEMAAVQVKSQSNLKEFRKYLDDFSKMDQYAKFFYIVHSPSEDLKNYEASLDDIQVNLYFGEKLSELVINSGLVDWLMRKIS